MGRLTLHHDNKSGKKIMALRSGLNGDEYSELRQAFNLFDTDGTGVIDPNELKAAMQSLGFESKNPTIYDMVSELASKNSNAVDFTQFVKAIEAKLGDKDSKEGIRKIFNLFDDDHTGTISFRNLKRVANELGKRNVFPWYETLSSGETLSDDELQEMIQRADSNGDNEISFEDFYAIMTKKTFP